jgi:hypothetical protein
VLLELDSSKGPGTDGVPPLILKNGASGFVLPCCMIFNGSLATCIFPDRCFVLKSIEDGCQVDSIYTDFSNAFDRVTFGQNV